MKNKIILSKIDWKKIGVFSGWLIIAKKISNCCGSQDCLTNNDGPSWSDIGICPKCKEHCEFEEITDYFSGKIDKTTGKAIYISESNLCPKCGCQEYISTTSSLPVIKQCIKCKYKWNPEYSIDNDENYMCDNCGSWTHHEDECPYSFGANPQ